MFPADQSGGYADAKEGEQDEAGEVDEVQPRPGVFGHNMGSVCRKIHSGYAMFSREYKRFCCTERWKRVRVDVIVRKATGTDARESGSGLVVTGVTDIKGRNEK